MSSSIPLPALGVRPPQQQPYLEQMGQAMQLKSMLGQQQLQGQQLRGAQLQNQKTQRDIDSENALMDAYRQAGGNWSEAIPLAAKSGKVTPQSMLQVQQAAFQQRMNAYKEVQTKGELAQQEADLFNGFKDKVNSAPAEQKAQVYQQGAQQLQRYGFESASALPSEYPGDEAFQAIGLGIQGHKQLVDEAAKQSEANKNQAQADEAAAAAKKTSYELGLEQQFGGLNPNLARLKYQNILQRLQGKQAVTQDEMDWARGYEASERKTSTSSDSLGINTVNVSGPSGLSSVGNGAGGSGIPAVPGATGGGMGTLVDEIGTGKMAISRLEYILGRKPNLLQAVAAKYPDFDASRVRAYIDAYRDFTSGPTSKQMNAGAVAMQHLAQLKKLNDQDTTGVRNPLSSSYKAYNNLLDTVADELVTFYGEPKTNDAISSKKATLGGLLNRDAAITEQANAMGVKLDELKQRWNNAAPSSAYQALMPDISPAAKAARAYLDPEYARISSGQQGSMPRGSGQPLTIKLSSGKTITIQ